MRLRIVLRGEPGDAFEPHETAEGAGTRPAAERVVDSLRVEWPPRAEDEGGDAVLGSFRLVLVRTRLDQPPRVFLGLLQAEAGLAEQERGVDAAVDLAVTDGGSMWWLHGGYMGVTQGRVQSA